MKETKVVKTDAQWKSELSDSCYQITRQKKTEPPFTGSYNECDKAGVYCCACCYQSLFSSQHKFNSGTGWPSFYQPITQDCLVSAEDSSLWMCRTEVLCACCDAHLGHVFDDGPPPTNLRYCINSVALILNPDAKT